MKYTLKFISIHTRRTVSQVFFFYGDSVIKSCERTQQGDPESPLGDDYQTVLKDLKKIVEAERTLGLIIKPSKCEIFFLITLMKNDDRQF